MRPPSENEEAPALDVNYYMGVYTIIYNFATASRIEKSPQSSASAFLSPFDLKTPSGSHPTRVKSMVGYELYAHLEEYFRGVAREICSKMPNDDSELLAHYLSSYTRYSSGAAIIHRQFAYLNRHFINRAVEEGMGWLSMQDVLLKSEREKRKDRKKTQKDIELLDARKKEVLKHWGFDGGTNEQKRIAESCAEANSPSEKIIPVFSLAHRCWRLDVIEPLLSASKSVTEIRTNGSVQNGANASAQSASSIHPNEIASRLESFSLNVSNSPHFISTTPNPPLSKSAKKRVKRQNEKGKAKEKEYATGNGVKADEPNDVLSPKSSPSHSNTSAGPTLSRASSTSQLRNGVPPSPSQPTVPPNGRLNRVVGELVLTPPRSPKDVTARETALKLSKSLRASGVSPDNIVRKRLDKYLKR